MARRPRVGLVVTAVLALILVAVVLVAAVLRAERARGWMSSVTGEEDGWEQAKGVAALALLELRGPRPELQPDAPMAHLGLGRLGVNVFLQLEADPENVRRSLAVMRDAGVTWARQQFPWEDIEIHAKGDWEDRRNEPPRSAWLKYDRIVQLAADHGIQLLARLDDPPDWAFADPAAAGAMGPPDDFEDYGDFVAAVGGRYCGRIRYYQLWNEPNIYPEWGERDVDPAGYARLLRLAAARLRQACPDAVVVSAALAQTTEPGGRNMDDLAYLEALYDLGWQEHFDVLAAQGFGLWTGPADRRASRDRANFARVQLARDIMVRRGDAAKAVWITEMGWGSPPDDMAAPYGRADEVTRARYTVGAYERMAREWPWAGVGFLWFLRRPNYEWHEQPQGYFRLVEPDWDETPSWRALAEHGRAAPVLHRGRHGVWAQGLRFSGPWHHRSADEGPAVSVGMPGAEVQFEFLGTGYTVFAGGGDAGDDAPALTVVLDGRAESLAPEPASHGDVRLSFGARGLAHGRHAVVTRVDVGTLALTEVRVEAPDPPASLAVVWRGLAAGAAVLALLAVAAAAALAGRRRALASGP